MLSGEKLYKVVQEVGKENPENVSLAAERISKRYGLKVDCLKVLKVFFEAIVNGDKTFEIRLNDRDFKPWQLLILQEINEKGDYTGGYIVKEISYIFDPLKEPKSYGIESGYVVLSIL